LKIIPAFDEAVSKFDNTCARVIREETIRIEEERLLAEAIEANAGKELDFFKDPELITAARAELKAEFKRCRPSQNKDAIRRTKTAGVKKHHPRWNFF